MTRMNTHAHVDMDTCKYIHEDTQVPGENLYLIVRRLSWNLVFSKAPHTSSRKPSRTSLQTVSPSLASL